MDPLKQFFLDHPEYCGRGVRKAPGYLTLTYVPLLASAQLAAQQVVNAADSDFIATSLTVTVTTTVSNVAYIQTPLLMQIVYAAYNTNITNTPAEVSGLAQTIINHAGPNGVFAYPLIIPKATQITTNVTNPIATDWNVWITFSGFRAYTP